MPKRPSPEGTGPARPAPGRSRPRPHAPAYGHALDQLVAQPDDRRIGQHHAQRGAGHHPQVGVVLGRQHHGGDLRLVAHLGEEEGDHRGAEDAEVRGARGIVVVELVGDQHPDRHGDEGQAQDPAHDVLAKIAGDPGAHGNRPAHGLTSVATKMPATMGQGLRKRAASTSDSSWVLSPISASATTEVEIRKASMVWGFIRPDRARIDHAPTPAFGSVRGQWSRSVTRSIALRAAYAIGQRRPKFVDAASGY
ncbi:hypothetical protein Ddc_22629 [Ditylenchus destructor]|nr:hypothetical protein Ddc_22629 [Ditylenchus destructor]